MQLALRNGRKRSTPEFVSCPNLSRAQEWKLWSYSPALLSGAATVAPLSLTLSLQDNADDRIQLALDELKGQLPW